jgi:molecular chaperone GrpE
MSDSDQTLQQQPERSEPNRPHDPAHQPPGASAPGGTGPAHAPNGAAGEAGDAAPAASEGPPGQPGGAAGQDADEAALRGDVDELVATAAQRDEYLALAQRTQADFENYRKRVARDAAAAHERGVGALAKELLPALDNLDRAIDAAGESGSAEDDPLLAGVRLGRSELAAALARVGIESYVPLGEPFDPTLHEAIATAPRPDGDGVASGTVVEVYQAGYKLGGNVIRPARVVVAA